MSSIILPYFTSALALCIACTVCISAAPAVAQAIRDLPATITAAGSPVRLDRCKATETDFGLSHVIAVNVDFTNLSSEPATAVRIGVQQIDAFDETLSTVSLDRLGTFSPDVPILARSNLAGTTNAGKAINAHPQVQRVICSVKLVHFADGSVWKEGAAVPPSLNYPAPIRPGHATSPPDPPQ